MKPRTKGSIRRKIIFRVFAINTITLAVVLSAMYFTLMPELNRRSIANAQSVNKQIIQETDNYLGNFKEYTDQIIYNDSFAEAFEDYFADPSSDVNYNIICLKLNSFASIKGNIKYLAVETDDSRKFTSILETGQKEMELLQSDWYQKIHNTDYANGFSNPYALQEGNQPLNYMAAYCKNFYLGTHRLTITVFFKINDIIDTTQDLMGKNLDAYMWVDASNHSFYSKGTDQWVSDISKDISNEAEYKGKAFEGYGGYNFINASENGFWTLASYVSYNSLFVTFQSFLFSIIFLIVIMFILSVTLLTPTITSITKPVSRLASTMSKVAGGDLNVVSKIETDDEIEELSDVFNKMVDDLKEYILKLLEKENAEQRMKYSLLISQIDPHFIYNTMNTINYLARKERYQDIVTINSALIKIMQDRLRVNNIEVFDSVEYEIDIVKQYILIQRYRYGDNVNVQWEMDETPLDLQIPKNIIQPLVENALFHGLTDEEDGQIHGNITISIESMENIITIKVTDDGMGIDRKKLEELNQLKPSVERGQRGKHIGLANIRERLLYLYGNEDCIHIESTPRKGTSVTLKLKTEPSSEIRYDS